MINMHKIKEIRYQQKILHTTKMHSKCTGTMISNGLGKKIGLFSHMFNVPNAVRDIIK